MYIREIQLNLPYKEKKEIINELMKVHNCTYEEAIQIDYDENWSIKVRSRFDLESRCMIDMFLRLLGKYKTKSCSKIVIDCVEKAPNTEYPCYRGSVMGVGVIHYEFDYKEFFAKSEYEKKQVVLEIIKKSFYSIEKEEELELAVLEDVFHKIEELGYNNFWVFGKAVKSPNKLYTAELYIEHKIQEIDFFAVVRNKQGEIVEKKLIVSEKPNRWMYGQYLCKLVWASDTEIHLKDKMGCSLFVISL
ncbi:hypothetical protein [Clostridium sp. HBUAS56017]|uniref:hypothetical protein n=1 Tax=Clostridium sp. HBUAS56017 TaxID=2571128 RepID=UPI0011783BE4|nr:hypothetical protein [Clostridium sp. HBUAS56017]